MKGQAEGSSHLQADDKARNVELDSKVLFCLDSQTMGWNCGKKDCADGLAGLFQELRCDVISASVGFMKWCSL